ncbi:MAG: hypothetical protein RL011_1037 [Pseudomonadota bacterium]|jgi:hypothetical protein
MQKNLVKLVCYLSLLLSGANAFSQSGGGQVPAQPASPANPTHQAHKPWYETISLRGYAQLRYNQLGVTNKNLTSDQGDKSIGGNNSLFLRRARLIVTANPTDRTMVYVQPDFAVTPVSSGPGHFLQVRDLYADYALTADKSSRLRFGQSKVPFGFENLQSSQNRLPLDRDDAINSAAKDERDLGVYYMWAPPEIRQRFKMLVDSGLKGSGDYGVFAIGAYNGQTANQPEANHSLHSVARLTYPFQIFGEQIFETSVQAYTGRYVVTKKDGTAGPAESLDQRVAASLIYYPQPFGVQAEYTKGKGPQYNAALNAIEVKDLEGGYILVSYKEGEFIPFVRAQTYRGGRKHDVNAVRYEVDEAEVGVEWQVDKSFEFTAEYVDSRRTNTKAAPNREHGRLARLQVQWNY